MSPAELLLAGDTAKLCPRGTSTVTPFPQASTTLIVGDKPKPSFFAVNWYSPGLRFLNTNAPSLPLTTVRSMLTSPLRMTTSAPGIGKPLAYRVTPWTSPGLLETAGFSAGPELPPNVFGP